MRMVLYGEKPYGTVPLLFILFQKIQRESAAREIQRFSQERASDG